MYTTRALIPIASIFGTGINPKINYMPQAATASMRVCGPGLDRGPGYHIRILQVASTRSATLYI